MANTLSVMIRNVVSKNRRRYTEGGFNLDLAYICDNIIAMGYPGEYIQKVFRNPINDVCHFFEVTHPEHYKIYNLRSDRAYDVNKFHGRVSVYAFEDHNPPTIELINKFCNDVDRWLKADSSNVAAIHCKAGKGRTGTMICCYLLYSGKKTTAEDALAFYGEKRTMNNKGVTIPSQRRYVQYYARLIRSKLKYERRTMQLCEIRFSASTHLQSHGSVQCLISTMEETDCTETRTSRVHDIDPSGIWTKVTVKELEKFTIDFRKTNILEVNELVTGDVKIELKKFFHFWINTYFVCDTAEYEGEGENVKLICTLTKWELDDAHKDKDHRTFPDDFKVKLVLKPYPHHTRNNIDVNEGVLLRQHNNPHNHMNSITHNANILLNQQLTHGTPIPTSSKSGDPTIDAYHNFIQHPVDRSKKLAILSPYSGGIAGGFSHVQNLIRHQHQQQQQQKRCSEPTPSVNSEILNRSNNKNHKHHSHQEQLQQQVHEQQQQQHPHHPHHHYTTLHFEKLQQLQHHNQQQQQLQQQLQNQKQQLQSQQQHQLNNKCSSSSNNIHNTSTNSNSSSSSSISSQSSSSSLSTGVGGGGGGGGSGSGIGEEEDWESGESSNTTTTSTTSTTTISTTTSPTTTSYFPYKRLFSSQNDDDDDDNSIKINKRNDVDDDDDNANDDDDNANDNDRVPDGLLSNNISQSVNYATIMKTTTTTTAITTINTTITTATPAITNHNTHDSLSFTHAANHNNPPFPTSLLINPSSSSLAINGMNHQTLATIVPCPAITAVKSRHMNYLQKKWFEAQTCSDTIEGAAASTDAKCATARSRFLKLINSQRFKAKTINPPMGSSLALNSAGVVPVASATPKQLLSKKKSKSKKAKPSNPFQWIHSYFRIDPDFRENLSQQTTVPMMGRRNSGTSVSSRNHLNSVGSASGVGRGNSVERGLRVGSYESRILPTESIGRSEEYSDCRLTNLCNHNYCSEQSIESDDSVARAKSSLPSFNEYVISENRACDSNTAALLSGNKFRLANLPSSPPPPPPPLSPGGSPPLEDPSLEFPSLYNPPLEGDDDDDDDDGKSLDAVASTSSPLSSVRLGKSKSSSPPSTIIRTASLDESNNSNSVPMAHLVVPFMDMYLQPRSSSNFGDGSGSGVVTDSEAYHDHDYYSSICDNQLSFNNSPCKSPRSLSDIIDLKPATIQRILLHPAEDLSPNNINPIALVTVNSSAPIVAADTNTKYDRKTSDGIVIARPVESHSIGFNVECTSSTTGGTSNSDNTVFRTTEKYNSTNNSAMKKRKPLVDPIILSRINDDGDDDTSPDIPDDIGCHVQLMPDNISPNNPKASGAGSSSSSGYGFTTSEGSQSVSSTSSSGVVDTTGSSGTAFSLEQNSLTDTGSDGGIHNSKKKLSLPTPEIEVFEIGMSTKRRSSISNTTNNGDAACPFLASSALIAPSSSSSVPASSSSSGSLIDNNKTH